MSWLRSLYQTYENNTKEIGVFQTGRYNKEQVLLPVAHTTQQVQIEVALDMDGNFMSAKVVDKTDASTIIPCTEASSSRTSAPVPHPLVDKLMYVAGDYVKYGGAVKKTDPHKEYLGQLRSWCNSQFSHPKVESVYNYLSKGHLVQDLIKHKIIYVDENKKFIEKWNKTLDEAYGLRPEIYKVVASNQSDAFVRFIVHKPGEAESRIWRDKTVHDSFIHYYESTLQSIDTCYVTGEMLPSTERHASKIRHAADMAKLISANDSSGFTYRGRFKQSKEAASISYEVSQKAHNALKWLIGKQGFSIDGKVFVVWGTDNYEIPDPIADTHEIDPLYTEDELSTVGDLAHQEYANHVRRAFAGYVQDLDYKANVIIMIVEAATPGRMAVVYYRDMNKEVFLKRLNQWHDSCYWLHTYKKSDGKFIRFMGAPATKDIAFAAYGLNASEKIVKELIERMLPSIIDGRNIPLDIVRSATIRASNPIGMDRWEWEKTLSIACALVRKTFEKEELTVGLDVNYDNRDYLFGRLLAIADVLERNVLDKEEKRATNAIRYMNAFARHPQRTWGIIQSNIQPYQASRQGQRLRNLNKLIDEVGSMIKPEDFTDKPLSGLYLLGFYSQRHELYKSKKEKDVEKGEM
ncbi:type I-C CRISPR-associated protein Cas8c/Csd1 [Sporosarcina sp. USHLN248]|uniref:type I-C CRISPR-associated protein Cas8c/Csd1 n=1 Tax=Sporosarcina sp. USHLN248 TaxID=3081300 RepID=UPI0030183FB6